MEEIERKGERERRWEREGKKERERETKGFFFKTHVSLKIRIYTHQTSQA